MIKYIFINSSEHRIRTGWRILTFTILFLISANILDIIISFFGGPPDDELLDGLLFAVLKIIIGSGLVLIGRKYLDRKSFKSLGLNFKSKGLGDLIFGFILSGLMISIIFITCYAMGYIEIENLGFNDIRGNTFTTFLLWLFILGVSVSLFEELTFRGYLLQNFIDGIGIRWAIALSCVLFGLAHLQNPNATIQSGIIITLITFILVLGWLRTEQLWISFGLHAGWNFFMGPVFGFPVSGFYNDSYLNLKISGPQWITGGEFGPENGILVFPAIIIGITLLLYFTRERKNTYWNLLINSSNS